MRSLRLGPAALSCLLAILWPLAAAAEVARVAVAANFAEPARALAAAFAASGPHEAVVSLGSTGQLYAQIAQGAPFDVFLSADTVRPAAAEKAGLAVAGRGGTYAIGRLALWSPRAGAVAGPEALGTADAGRVAIANPVTAPYGAAAMQTIAALGLTDELAPRLVRGANVAQAFQFVATGNATLGFVALPAAERAGGSHWAVPARMHDPIRQDAVLLRHGADNPAAGAFLAFLFGAEGRRIVAEAGYLLPASPPGPSGRSGAGPRG